MEGGDHLGPYVVLEPLGSGGMGAVWIGEDPRSGRRVAIKVLKPELAARPDIVGRFVNEARAAMAISDPGIVEVLDAGEHEGLPYIVMELLEGESLEAALEHRGPLTAHEALRIAHQVATTLGATHAANIVHRDVKPANIYLTKDARGIERTKVLDFGIAKLGELSAVKTTSSAVMGTPLYMSPEQCRGAGEVDARSDVYSVGCVLFAMVAGRPPFEGLGGGEIIGKHQFQAAPPVSAFASVPPTFDALVARCLAKDPAQRFADGRALAAAIDELITRPSYGDWIASLPDDLRVVAQMQDPLRSGTQPPSPTTLGGSAMVVNVRSSRAPWIVAGVLVCAAAAALAVFTNRSTGDGARPAAPPDPHAVTRQRIADALASWRACPAPADTAALLDGWGHAMRVSCADGVTIVSSGPDEAFGTADDITAP